MSGTDDVSEDGRFAGRHVLIDEPTKRIGAARNASTVMNTPDTKSSNGMRRIMI